MEKITIDTDAALVDSLAQVFPQALPGAQMEITGPLRESVLPPEGVHWAYAGTIAVLTATGGAKPALDGLRAVVRYLLGAYHQSARMNSPLRATRIRYRDKEVSLDVTSQDAQAALQALRDVLEQPEPK